MLIHAGDVFIRGYQDSDEKAIVRLLRDPEVMEMALSEKALSEPEAEQFIAGNLALDAEPCMDVVCLRATGQVIGFAGFRPCDYLGEDDLEFGFVLAKEQWRKGYATAIGRKLILHAQHGLDLHRVLAACNPENRGSDTVLGTKLKMTFVREVVLPDANGGKRRRVYEARFDQRD